MDGKVYTSTEEEGGYRSFQLYAELELTLEQQLNY